MAHEGDGGAGPRTPTQKRTGVRVKRIIRYILMLEIGGPSSPFLMRMSSIRHFLCISG